MRNLSIRTRILAGVVLVNLLGAAVAVIYLHGSFSKSLDVAAQQSMNVAVASWADITTHTATGTVDVTGLQTSGSEYLERMKAITGGDYGLMIDKKALDEEAYAASSEALKQPSNWDERETYVLVADTDEALSDKMQLQTPPGDIPENGKFVGIENGACTQMCHDNVKGDGDFWVVQWSDDGKSRAHTVFPVNDQTGNPTGVVYGISDITTAADSAESSLFSTMWVILTTLLVATLFIGWMLDVLVLRRLAAMSEHVHDLSLRVAGGDFDAHFEADGTTDEIGSFETFFSRFVDVMTNTIKSLQK